MNDKKLEWIIHLDDAYYMKTFGKRIPVAFTHGKGMYLFSTDEKKYMDMIGGIAVNVLGHGHPALSKAIAQQAKHFIHCSNYYYIENQGELARALVQKCFADKVFFSNSGAEANETAIKLARAYFAKKGTPRAKIVTAQQSFHGRTLATAAATGQEQFKKLFLPLPEGFVHVQYNDTKAALSEIDDKTCAVMIELMQGESGVYPADKAYIKAIRDRCDQTGTLLIVDEVQTGIGRTGTLFMYEQFDVLPDILTAAKGLGGGVPIGATLATDKVASAFAPGDHGSTFGGNPLATAAARTVLQEIDANELVAHAQVIGNFIMKKLKALSKKQPRIVDVRGKGLLIGIELASNDAVALKMALLTAGFLVGSIGPNIIRIAPPLIITKRHASAFVSALEAVLEE